MPIGHNLTTEYSSTVAVPGFKRVTIEMDALGWEKIYLVAQSKGIRAGVLLEPFIEEIVERLVKDNPEVFQKSTKNRATKRKLTASE